jgi:hypothetical protein
VTRYIVRTTSALGTKNQTKFKKNGGDDGGVRDDGLETEREADLPPLLCACDGWRVPEPDEPDDANGERFSSEIVSITVRVVAENDAGRSKPASLVVEVPFLVARALAAATAAAGDDDGKKEASEASGDDTKLGTETCPAASPRAPLAPPLGLRATRLADDAVFADWSPPPSTRIPFRAEATRRGLERSNPDPRPSRAPPSSPRATWGTRWCGARGTTPPRASRWRRRAP